MDQSCSPPSSTLSASPAVSREEAATSEMTLVPRCLGSDLPDLVSLTHTRCNTQYTDKLIVAPVVSVVALNHVAAALPVPDQLWINRLVSSTY